MNSENEKKTKTVYRYHEETKHHTHRSARSVGYMDWDNEPNPFRFYEGAEQINLPLIQNEKDLPYSTLYHGRPGKTEPVTHKTIAALLELSVGLSAWKKYGESQWALRMNPSSGNLHPTECYLILPSLERHKSCVVHYNPHLHCLEILTQLDDTASTSLSNVGGFGLILTSIHWREAWKYGERAFRYCNHDAGHAMAALRFSANLLGWRMRHLPQIDDGSLDSFMGFDAMDWIKWEEERIDCLCWLNAGEISVSKVKEFFQACRTGKIIYQPNRLSREHDEWEIIHDVSQAICSTWHDPHRMIPRKPLAPQYRDSPVSAQSIIRRRRSAQAFDISKSKANRSTFFTMLEKTIPAERAPFDCFSYDAETHLAIFVHNVETLDPGLYLLIRNPGHEEELRSLLSAKFLWREVESGFPLYLLQPGNYRNTAQLVSCQQDIAGDSAFSLGMLARFQAVVGNAPWMYPRLFWETGAIGQVLYLEAEAHGLRGTGIGCYFDDVMHDLLGLEDNIYQSLYHFTIGVPLEDKRIQTIAPYSHLSRQT